jgi:hypothetical protein
VRSTRRSLERLVSWWVAFSSVAAGMGLAG